MIQDAMDRAYREALGLRPYDPLPAQIGRVQRQSTRKKQPRREVFR